MYERGAPRRIDVPYHTPTHTSTNSPLWIALALGCALAAGCSSADDTCGDDTIQAGESCDGSNLDGASCNPGLDGSDLCDGADNDCAASAAAPYISPRDNGDHVLCFFNQR